MVRFGALLICAYASCATTAFATQPEPDTPRLTVSISDLNLNDSKGVSVAYRRIEWAAQRVCPLADSADYWLRVSAEPCIAQAIGRAIESIGSPELAAYARSQRSFRPAQPAGS